MSSSLGSQTSVQTGARRTVPATRPLLRYRTVDLVTAAMLGVAFGVAFWGWDLVYTAPSNALYALFAPLTGLLAAPWLLGGLVGGLVVRRPGAALITEIVGASVEALIGNQWGWGTVISGGLQGLGVEIALAIFLWKRFGPGVAMLGGLLAAVLEVCCYEWWAYVADFSWTSKLVYLGSFALSAVVVAGPLAWAITRALAKTGAIRSLPPGQEELERSAV